jgi:hypothetical protein
MEMKKDSTIAATDIVRRLATMSLKQLSSQNLDLDGAGCLFKFTFYGRWGNLGALRGFKSQEGDYRIY